MAKRCVICKRKLSESLFTSHPLKCDECWTKELKPVKKASERVKRSFVKHEGETTEVNINLDNVEVDDEFARKMVKAIKKDGNDE